MKSMLWRVIKTIPKWWPNWDVRVAGGGKESLDEGRWQGEKPPILGMIQRNGEVVLHMLANVPQKTIQPLFKQTILIGRLICDHSDP